MPQSAEGDDLYEDDLQLAWSHDGRRVAYLSRERHGRTLRIVEARSGRVLRRLAAPTIYAIGADAFSPSGDRLAYASGVYGYPTILDIATGRTRRSTGVSTLAAAWSPTDDRIAVGSGGGVRVGDASASFGPVRKVGGVEDLRWSPDGTALALLLVHDATDYKSALAVLPPEGAPRMLLPYADAGVSSPQWSPDGTKLALAR
jgi:dipeptidyl aminopeptidase/acylaminoacyl peptidase